MKRSIYDGVTGWVDLILGFGVIGLFVVGGLAFLIAIVRTFILG